MDKARKHLSHPDKNTRQSAITLFMNYSILFNNKDDQEGRTQGIAAFAQSVMMETDLQNLLRSATALGNLCHNNEEAYAHV